MCNLPRFRREGRLWAQPDDVAQPIVGADDFGTLIARAMILSARINCFAAEFSVDTVIRIV